MLYRGTFFVFTLALGFTGFGISSPLAILQENCVSCHSHSKKKGGLLIDSRESLIKGGDSGAALVPGDSAKSLLIETIFPDADPHMPPKGQLKPQEIAELEKWVKEGAAWDPAFWSSLTRPQNRDVNITSLPDGYKPVLAMALSPNRNSLAVGRGNRTEIYEVTKSDDKKIPVTLALKQSFEGHADQIQSLVF